jgi:hypothetical protein
LVTLTIAAVIGPYWVSSIGVFNHTPHALLGLSLPGVSLVTWTILGVIKWCPDCKIM